MSNNLSFRVTKNIFTIFFFFLFTGTVLLAQDNYHPDYTIIKKRIPGQGVVYTSHGKVISKDEVDSRLTRFDESALEYEKSLKRCERDDYYDHPGNYNGRVDLNLNVSAPPCHSHVSSDVGGHYGPRGGHGGGSVGHGGGGGKCSGKGALIVGVAVLAVGVIIVTPLICEAIIRHDHYKKAIRIYNEKVMNQYTG